MRIGGPAALVLALALIVGNGWIYVHGNTVGRGRRWMPPGRTENLSLVLITIAVTVLLGGAILLRRKGQPELARQIGVVYFIVVFALGVASWWLS